MGTFLDPINTLSNRCVENGGGNMKEVIIKHLKQRGIELEEIVEIVYDLQKVYYSDLDKGVCQEAINAVLEKREVQYAVLTGLALDKMAEEGLLPEPIQTSKPATTYTIFTSKSSPKPTTFRGSCNLLPVS